MDTLKGFVIQLYRCVALDHSGECWFLQPNGLRIESANLNVMMSRTVNVKVFYPGSVAALSGKIAAVLSRCKRVTSSGLSLQPR